MTLCKICDIRDWSTAQECARLGANYLGLHAIWEVKPERLSAYIEIVNRLSKLYSRTKTVLVTRQQNVSKIIKMAELIKPYAIQLHAAWSPPAIKELRQSLHVVSLDDTQIIGVVASSEQTLDRAIDISGEIDLLLVDRTLYETSMGKAAVTRQTFLRIKELVYPLPVFLAGGLNPKNVKEQIDLMQPDGVDVQTGVEYPNMRGVKDLDRVAAFIRAVHSQKKPEL